MPIVWTEDRQWKPMPSSPYTLERLRMVHGAKILAKTLLGFTRILEIFWVRRRFSRHNKRIKLRVYNRSAFDWANGQSARHSVVDTAIRFILPLVSRCICSNFVHRSHTMERNDLAHRLVVFTGFSLDFNRFSTLPFRWILLSSIWSHWTKVLSDFSRFPRIAFR